MGKRHFMARPCSTDSKKAVECTLNFCLMHLASKTLKKQVGNKSIPMAITMETLEASLRSSSLMISMQARKAASLLNSMRLLRWKEEDPCSKD